MLAHFSQLTMELTCLALHAPVDPVNLNLIAGNQENVHGLLWPQNK